MSLIKNEVLVRTYIVLLFLTAFASVIFFKAFKISKIEGDKWRTLSDSLYKKEMPIEPLRGNIYADDGSLLATSLPYFEIRFDPSTKNLDSATFYRNIDSLALCITRINPAAPGYTEGGWGQYLRQCRARKERYVLVKDRAQPEELERIKRFPLFRLGKYKGGLIVKQLNNREHPFGMLAQRTIGYIKEDRQKGIEGTFNTVLGGVQGREVMFRVGKDLWLPMTDLSEVKPENGDDIVTTIDVNLQDIAQEALLRSLQNHNADHGCAVVMDVKTGAIKAIANLGKTQEGYGEIYNYAIAKSTEPGSTFKLASMMALLSDDKVTLEDTVDLNYGKTKFYKDEMIDSEKHGLKYTTVRHAFEMSSNVGISRLIQKFYGDTKKADDYIEHLRDYRLDKNTEIDLNGETSPYIKTAYDAKDDWSGTTLPWMSIGYESKLTPLQILNFYNAIANDGTMMKPYLVSEFQRYGETYKKFRPTVKANNIASKKVIARCQELLEGVVNNGTMKPYKSGKYNYAGKTGTAQFNYSKLREQGQMGYQASFVGYFPAEAPVYSCIVVVYDPRQGSFYGADCAGSVFKEIADKAFTIKTELHEPLNKRKRQVYATNMLPVGDAGNTADMDYVLNNFDFKYYKKTKRDFAALNIKGDSLKIVERNIVENVVPNVVGMRLKDALFLLENRGCKVGINGYGIVKGQSVPAGTKVQRGMYVGIVLQ
jgi:cell division protein FtsI (penicillin-binding protein 3)